MELSGTSPLQGALRNYLRSEISHYQYLSESAVKYERYIIIMKLIILCCTGAVGVSLIEIYCDWYYMLINLTLFYAVIICFFCLLFRKYIPWRYNFYLFRNKFCPWISPIVFTGDRRIQTEEHIASQTPSHHNTADEQTASHFADRQDSSEEHIASHSAAQHNTIDERTAYRVASQHDSSQEHVASHSTTQHNKTDEQTASHLTTQYDSSEERIANQSVVLYQRSEEQTSLFTFRKNLPSLNIFRIICCPRSCYSTSTVSTEDLDPRNEVHTTSQIAAPNEISVDQTVNQLYRTQDEMFLLPSAPQITYEEVFAKLQLTEQRLLQYLQSNPEE